MRQFNVKFINAYTIVRDILFNWWVVLLALIIGFGACRIYFSQFVTKHYTSSMTISINISGYTATTTTSSLSKTVVIAESFQNVLQSSTLVSVIEQQLGEPITSSVTASQITDTNLIKLSVTDTNPQKAFQTLNLIFENYHLLTEDAFSDVLINVMVYPTMPVVVTNWFTQYIYAAFGAVVTAGFVILLLAIISYFRETIKNETDVENILDSKLFGTVYHVDKKMKKSKTVLKGLMMNSPLIDYRFADSFRSMAMRMRSLKRSRDIKSYTIASFSENEGKTTIAVNLSIALAEAGQKVVLIDADFKQPAVYNFFEKDALPKDKEFSEYILGNARLEDVTRFDERTGVYLLGGKEKTHNSSEIINSDKFRELIKLLEEEYDFVIIDTPPAGIAIDVEIAYEMTDALVMVIRQDVTPADVINNFLANVEDDKLLGCVLNDYHTFKKIQSER